MSDLTLTERAQLRTLKAVYDNPTITATWRKHECDRLVELGLAQRHEIRDTGIMVVAITDAGLEAAASLGKPHRVVFDPNEIHEDDAP